METNLYALKSVIRFLFSEIQYHKIKLYKIIFDYKLGLAYEISPVLNKLVRGSDVVFDIGANMGQFACRFNKLLDKTGVVYAFEPVDFNFQALIKMQKILKLNNTIVYDFAIGLTDGPAIIKIPEFDNGLVVGTRATLLTFKNYTKYREQAVMVKSVDSFIAETKIERLDFIKCDTEGNEINVLNGGINSIIRFKPTMYLEMNYRHPELLPFYNMGYSAFHYSANKKIEKISDKQKGDLILIHESRRIHLSL